MIGTNENPAAGKGVLSLKTISEGVNVGRRGLLGLLVGVKVGTVVEVDVSVGAGSVGAGISSVGVLQPVNKISGNRQSANPLMDNLVAFNCFPPIITPYQQPRAARALLFD